MEEKAKKQFPWKKVLKWTGIGIGTIAALILLFATVVVWILTPERLTPLIEKYGSEYLIADVKLEKAELSFWSTFPRLEIDLQRLDIVSRSLEGVSPETRRDLPAWADSLLSMRSFHGGVNILGLMAGKIKLYDLEIENPRINLVAVNDSVANYNIVPPSDKEKPDTSVIKIPDISLNRFLIKGGMPVRYISLSDSVKAGVNISVIDFDGENNPRYGLELDGDASASLGPWFALARLPIVVNGQIGWSHKNPLKLTLDDFIVAAGPVKTVTDTEIDFNDEIAVNRLSTRLEQVKLVDVLNLMPNEYKQLAKGIATDLSVGALLEISRPYLPASTAIPTGLLKINIPGGYVKYDGYTLDRLAADLNIAIDGSDIDRTVVNIDKITASGEGVDFTLKGMVTSVTSDPAIEGTFDGTLNLARLPKQLLNEAGVTAKGVLNGKFEFRLRQSYLSPAEFHRILLNGEATLSGLYVDQSELGASLFSKKMVMKLGTSDSFIRNNLKSDSLLTASIKADTIYCALPGMSLSTRDIMLGLGAKNTAHKVGSKDIIPLGGVFKVKTLRFNSTADSMRIRLRDITARASLQRYEGHAKVPLLKFSLDAGSMRYGDPLTRISFKETNIDASLHMRLKPRMNRRMTQCYDSLRVIYPKLRPDSVYRLAQAEMRKGRTPGKRMGSRREGTETIDYGLDSETKQWLKWIDFHGRLTSKRARLFTPYFPVRNRLSDVDVTITPDSLNIRDTRYKMGRSDFLINGTVSNISRALSSSRQTMKINLDIKSDTIDVNEIAEAAFAGAAFAEKLASGAQITLGDTDNEELMQKVVEQTAASDEAAPLIIPSNIEATLRMHADNIIYADLGFKDFTGEALLYDGALNLHRLSASTDMGSVALSALYTAPTKSDLSFAFGLDVKDLQLDKFIQLVPAVDSLMPLLQSIRGIVNAEVAATSKVDSAMNLVIPSLSAAIKITGDSLVLLDDDTFRTISKWMLFKNKKRNMVDHMEVQVVVENSMLELFPFIFEIDRYRLGVMGSNDVAMNYNYHVSVLKSPIPFKFGINIKGNPDKMKIRLGKAKFKENMMVERAMIVDTTRINLIQQIENVFRRGVSRGRVAGLNVKRPDNSALREPESGDTISGADSLLFIREGLLPAPPAPDTLAVAPQEKTKKGKKDKKK